MNALPKIRLPLLAAIVVAVVGCSSGSEGDSAPAPEAVSPEPTERTSTPPEPTERAAAPATEVPAAPDAASPGTLRPDPHEAKLDKGRMFDDGCIVKGEDTSARGCIYGKRDSDVTVVLVGDSHALQYGPAMIELANQRGWRLLALARADCVIAKVDFNASCSEWRRKAKERIRKIEPDMIVVSASTGSQFQVEQDGDRLSRKASEPVLRTGMARTMRQLGRFKSKRGKRAEVVLIRDQVLAPFRPPDCLKKKANQRKPSRCGFKADRPESTAFDFHGSRRVKAVRIVDPIELLCPKGWCRAVEDGMIIYRDRYHYTATWAETIAPWLGKQLGDPR